MARPQYPSDKQDQFMVRLPGGMRDILKEIASINGRSMNAEIVERLSKSMQWPQISLPPEIHEEAIELPVGVLSKLEAKFQRDIETLVAEAIYSHKISQGNLINQFEMLVEYAPEEERPRLRQQIRDLLIRAGISAEHVETFNREREE